MAKSFNIFLLFILLISGLFADASSISTLIELKKSESTIDEAIKEKNILKNRSRETDEKIALSMEIKDLDNQSNEFHSKFERIATGIDININASFDKNAKDESSTTLSEDFKLLLKPLLQGTKESTERMRNKAKLNEELKYYQDMLTKATKGYNNISLLLEEQNITAIRDELLLLQKDWEQKISLINSNFNASQQHIRTLEKEAVSFAHSFFHTLQGFFEQRGRIILEGLIAFFMVLFIMKFFHIGLVKVFPIMLKPSRSFSIRLLDLFYRILMVFLSVLAPILVFYYEEDWVLSSIGALIVVGLLWAFRTLVPKLWQQARLILNIGAVREEERIYYHSLPWRVKNINIFTMLENPDSGVRLRLPIEELVGLVSRPSLKYEPWFPCRLNDWVLLSNGDYGKVVGISLEFVETTDSGGGHKTFTVSDFISLSPLNISTGFRIVTKIGISYKHQKEITTKIITDLESYIQKQIIKEEYEKDVKSLIVQFSDAGDSSLNIGVFISFSGDMASVYFRLRRAISRWCVDACTLYEWEIPFPQLTVHQAK